MTEQFKFYFDGLKKSCPKGWEKMVETMTRDKTLKGIFITHDVALEFTGDSYRYLWEKKQDGFCSQVQLEIFKACNDSDSYESIYVGIIEISDCEFNLLKCICKTKINDNTFYAKINNNKSLDCFLLAPSSKNGLTIPAIGQSDLKLYKVANGAYYTTIQSGCCFKAYEVLKHLIAFMSDDEVDFDSTLFGAGGDFENLVFTNGFVIRSIGAGTSLSAEDFKESLQMIKYNNVFQELDRRRNLGFYFDFSGTKPKIWIEKYEDTKLENVIIDVPKVKEIVNSFFVEKLYSAVKLGTSGNTETGSFPGKIRFFGFREEEFNTLGKCNLDNALELQCDFISDTNSIEASLGGDKGYDEDWFLIDCDNVAGTMVAKQSNWLVAPPPYYYNERLTNQNCILRFLGAIPSAIAAFLGGVDSRFLATLTTDLATSQCGTPPATEPVRFDDDFTLPNFDTSNVYGNGTTQGTPVAGVDSRFTAPQIGIYKLNTHIIIDIQNLAIKDGDANYNTWNSINFICGETLLFSGGGKAIYIDNGSFPGTSLNFMATNAGPFTGTVVGATSGAQGNVTAETHGLPQLAYEKVIQIKHYDSLGGFIDSAISTSNVVSGINTVTLPFNSTADLNDYYVVSVQYQSTGSIGQFNATIKAGSYFESTDRSSSDGIFQTFDPEDYPVEKYEFSTALTWAQYKKLRSNAREAITFNDGKNFLKGWVDTLKYNIATPNGPQAHFTIITSKNFQR